MRYKYRGMRATIYVHTIGCLLFIIIKHMHDKQAYGSSVSHLWNKKFVNIGHKQENFVAHILAK